MMFSKKHWFLIFLFCLLIYTLEARRSGGRSSSSSSSRSSSSARSRSSSRSSSSSSARSRNCDKSNTTSCTSPSSPVGGAAGGAVVGGVVAILSCCCCSSCLYKRFFTKCKICGETIAVKNKEAKAEHYKSCQEINKVLMDVLHKDDNVKCDLNHAMYIWNNKKCKSFTCDNDNCTQIVTTQKKKGQGKRENMKTTRKKVQENKCENNMYATTPISVV